MDPTMFALGRLGALESLVLLIAPKVLKDMGLDRAGVQQIADEYLRQIASNPIRTQNNESETEARARLSHDYTEIYKKIIAQMD